MPEAQTKPQGEPAPQGSKKVNFANSSRFHLLQLLRNFRRKPVSNSSADSHTNFPEQDNYWSFSFDGQGLSVNSLQYTPEFLPAGARVARVDFEPNRLIKHEKGYTFQPMEIAIDDFGRFFKYTQQLSTNNKMHSVPEYLWGKTNERMARFAKNIGFSVQKRKEDDRWDVYGEIDTIRQRYNEEVTRLQENGTLDRIRKFAQAEQKRKKL